MLLITVIVCTSVNKGILLTKENSSIIFYEIEDNVNFEAKSELLSEIYQNGFENVTTKDLIKLAMEKGGEDEIDKPSNISVSDTDVTTSDSDN